MFREMVHTPVGQETENRGDEAEAHVNAGRTTVVGDMTARRQLVSHGTFLATNS